MITLPDFFTTSIIAELVCLIIALLCLLKDKSLGWKGIMWYMLLVCIAELSGRYIKLLNRVDRGHVHYNSWIYNLLTVFEAGFISLMFAKLLSRYIKSWPVILIGLAWLYIIYIYEIISHGIYLKTNLTTTVMAVLFILYSLYYLYLLFKDEKYIDLKYSAEFWWVAGVLFFYFGTTACNVFYPVLSSVLNKPNQHTFTRGLYIAFNVLLYSCWTYSFICRKWLRPTSAN